MLYALFEFLYSGLSSLNMSSTDAFFGALLVILLVPVVFYLCLYVLNSLGRQYVLKCLGFRHPWLAWFDVLGVTMLAACCDEGEKTVNILGRALPLGLFMLWPLADGLWRLLPTDFLPLGIVVLVFCFAVDILLGGAMYAILYAKMEGKTRRECAVLGYITAAFPIIAMVKFLLYRVRKQQPPTLAAASDLPPVTQTEDSPPSDPWN